MSVSDQLFVSHFPIPQGLRVMISQILLTCLSSRIGTHLLECMASGHSNHFFPLCQFSRHSTVQTNAGFSSIFIPQSRPLSPQSSPLQSEGPSAVGLWGPNFVFWKASSCDLLLQSSANGSLLSPPSHHHQRHLLTRPYHCWSTPPFVRHSFSPSFSLSLSLP